MRQPLFLYHPGTSLIHRLDPRTKLLFLLVCSGLILYAGLCALGVISGLLIGALLMTGISPLIVGKTIKSFLPLLLLIFTVAAAAYNGNTGSSDILESGILVGLGPRLTRGVITAWRFLLFILLSTAVIASTRLSEIRRAAAVVTRSYQLGMMLSLTLAMLPLIARQTEILKEAQKARGVEMRKNPIQRIKLFMLPLLFDVFHRSDDISSAMQARCYSVARTESPLIFHKVDFIALIITVSLLVITVFLWLSTETR